MNLTSSRQELAARRWEGSWSAAGREGRSGPGSGITTGGAQEAEGLAKLEKTMLCPLDIMRHGANPIMKARWGRAK